MVNISKKQFKNSIIFFCIIVILVDIFLLHRHSHFADSGLYSIDGMNAFFGILSFVGTLIIFFVANLIFKLFSVSEDYYNDDF